MPPSFAEKDLNYYLRMIRGDFAELEEGQPAPVVSSSKQKNIVLFLGSQQLGKGEPELGSKLLKYFLKALLHHRVKPRALILVNEAVHLSKEGSPVENDLVLLSEQGLQVVVCVVSADELGVAEEEIAVGAVADMDKICEYLLSAWKVISL